MQCRFVQLLPAVLLVAQACDKRPERLTDNAIQELREGMPGITEQCLEQIKYGGIEAMPLGTDKCFEMGREQRWKGLWRREFENSRFCPSPATFCSHQTAGERIWLSGKVLSSSGNGEGIFAVEFVGRRTARKGSYGHLGAFDHEIIADKIITLRPVVETSNSSR